MSTLSSSSSTSTISNTTVHRYNQLLPSTHVNVETEGKVLLTSILTDLRQAVQQYTNDGHYDYVLALRQIKRLHALLALKYELPDNEWKEIVESMLKIALSDGLTLPRQSSLFGSLNRLLVKKRDTSLLTLPWRPYWSLLQSIYLSHVNSRALASSQYTGNHLKNLVTLIRYSTRYFPASAAGEIVATCTVSLSHTNSHAMFNAQALLYVFLPSSVCIEELPPGTAEHWIRVWSWVDHCNEWDAIWAGIFARLAHPDGIVDVDGYRADNTPIVSKPGAFPWGTYIPFFASKLQAALRIPVAGGQPIGKTYPYESSALISGAMPNGIDSICKLLVRILTVKVPPMHQSLYGDSTAIEVSSSSSSSSSSDVTDPVRTDIGDASVLGYLERLLRATASFFYPTSTNNAGFITFLRNLSQLVVIRFGREAGAAQATALLRSANIPIPPPEERAHAASEMGTGGTPPLTVSDIVRFVDVALPLAILGLYSQKGQSSNVWEASVTLKALAALAPARVTREFVTMASVALDPGTVNQTHQGPNALYALSILTRPLLFPVPHLAPTLPDFLHLSLPGIDANDNAKTSATLSFYITVLSTLPLIDSDDLFSNGNDDETVALPPWHPASPAFTGVPLGAPLPHQLNVKPTAGGALRANLSSILSAGIVRASGPADRNKDGSRITVVENGSNDDESTGTTVNGPTDRSFTDKELTTLIKQGPEPAVRDLFLAAREGTSRIGEWAILVLERIFKVLEVLEKPAKAKSQGRRAEGISSLLTSFFQHYFIQCSPSLLTQILNRIHTWLTSISCLDGVKDVAKMLNGLAMANPEKVLNKLVPYHTKAATAPGTSDKIIEWHARLLAGLVRQTGTALLPHLPSLLNVIKVAFASKEKPTRKAGGKLLRWMLTSLLSTYAMDNRSHAPEDWQQPSTLWRKWAQPYQWTETLTPDSADPLLRTTVPSIRMQWHVPSEEERQAALTILNDYLVAPMVRVQQFLTMITSSTDPTTVTTNLSSTASVASFSPAVIKAEAEKLTLDCSIMLAAVRGGVFALTDGTQYNGDDDVIAVGTAGQSLLYDTRTSTASYATPSSSSSVATVSLRHALALTMQQMLRIVGSHTDFSKEVKALTIAIKFSFRLVASRGPKMSKTIQARTSLKNFKRYYHDHAEGVRTSHFTKILAAAAHAAGYRDTTSIVSTRGSTHQLDRGGMISRIVMMMNRRIAESLYAIPRALHFGRSPATIGEVDWDMDDDEPGDDDEVLADTEDLETPSAGVDTDTTMDTVTSGSSSTVSVWLNRDTTLAVPSFGKRCIAKVTVEEQPYVLLLASTLQLAMHPYDNVRKSAQSHVLTMISTYGWLRKPAQLRALSRLDRLASFAVSAQASAKAPELKAAAENYLAALTASNKLPSAIPPEILSALKEGTMPSPSALAALVTPTPVAGNENGSKTATVGSASTGTPAFFGDTETKLTTDTSTGPPSVLFSPSMEAKLATKPTVAPLDHAEVLGLSSIAFMNIGPLISEWFSFERMATVLLRSSQIVKGLPVERHAEVLRSLSRDAIRVLGYWHAIPIDPSHRSAHIHRTVRDRVLRYLLGTACPLAMNTEADLPTTSSTNSNDVTMSTGELSSSTSSPSRGTTASSSTATAKVPKVLQADGTRGPSAAFFPPSPLHWRYELLAGGLMLSLLAPGPATPCRLAIDSSRHEVSLTHHGDDSTTSGRYMVAPEAVWLWVLSNILSDNVFLRMQAVYGLVQLLHAHVEMRGAQASNLPVLAKVRELLTNPKYVSQFVAAIAQNHSEQGGEGSNVGGIETAMDTTGVRDLALPLDSVRAFVEFSRHSFSGGAVSSITHMILFELLHLAFPECLDICLDSLRQLGSEKGAEKAATATASTTDAAMIIEGETASSTGTKTGETETAKNSHELATLRNRQATVAEAFAGFVRSVSFRRTPGGPNGGLISYSSIDATVPSPDTLPNPYDQVLTKIMTVVAPIIENVSLDWTPDWTNAVRFAIRQRHPSQMGPLVRYIFANAINAIESSDIRIPSAYDTAGLETFLDRIRKYSSNAKLSTGSTNTGTIGTGTGTKSTGASTALSFVAQSRWLKFVQAVFFEFFATIDGNGCSGSLPGVTAGEEIAAETNVHADAKTIVAEHGSELLSTRQTTAALLCSILPVLIRALGHPYKNCREEITRTIMVAVETGWAPSDVQATSPVPLPTIHTRSPDGNWTDTRQPVLLEPPTTQWMEWLVPTVTAMVHMASAAFRLVGKSGTNKMDDKDTTNSTTSGTVPVSEEEKWGRSVLESILYFIYDGLGADTVVTNPVLLVLAPIILVTQNHPDRDVSKLSSVVIGQFSHTLTLRRVHPEDFVYDAKFYRNVEQLFSSTTNIATISASSVNSTTNETFIQSDALHSGADIMVRTLEAYGMLEDSSTTAATNDETVTTTTTATATKKATATAPPILLRSPIISALQPVRTGGGTGSTAGTTTTTTTTTKADQTGSTWFVRRAVLNFITPMRARHLLVLTKPQDNILVNFIENRLDDKQIEVQEAANKSLIGFVMTMPLHQRIGLAKRLLTLVDTKMPKRPTAPVPVPGQTEVTPEENENFRKAKVRFARALRKRHAGCLGISSIAAAHPFDVPKYLPSVLAALARHVSDPNPVGNTVKECIGEFRRTHADNWDQHKTAFTQDELDDILAVTSGGSYFA